MNNKISIWLDDIRIKPVEYDIHVKSSQEAIALLETGNVTKISLDHDLGLEDWNTGYIVAVWIERAAAEGKINRLEWHVHSANPVGKRRMIEALTNADKYWNATFQNP